MDVWILLYIFFLNMFLKIGNLYNFWNLSLKTQRVLTCRSAWVTQRPKDPKKRILYKKKKRYEKLNRTWQKKYTFLSSNQFKRKKFFFEDVLRCMFGMQQETWKNWSWRNSAEEKKSIVFWHVGCIGNPSQGGMRDIWCNKDLSWMKGC